MIRHSSRPVRWFAVVAMAAAAFVGFASNVVAGTWTQLTNSPPAGAGLMELLPDGTVMVQNGGGNAWYRLTPDIHGSYLNGTWTTLNSMNSTRLYNSTQVLTDGRLFTAGGEYGTGDTTSEVYDPM